MANTGSNFARDEEHFRPRELPVHGGWSPGGDEIPLGVRLRSLSSNAQANLLAHCRNGIELTEQTIQEMSRKRLLNDDRSVKAGVCEALRNL